MTKKLSLILAVLFLSSCSSKLLHNSNENNYTNFAKAPETGSVLLAKTEVADSQKVVFFETDSAKLSSDAIVIIDKNILPLVKDSKTTILNIEGYCDERGSASYNKKLGKKRANAVKEYLAKNGIESSQIKVVSYGESFPVDAAHNEEAWAKNRRAVTIFIKK